MRIKKIFIIIEIWLCIYHRSQFCFFSPSLYLLVEGNLTEPNHIRKRSEKQNLCHRNKCFIMEWFIHIDPYKNNNCIIFKYM